jgi:hypothetical protein
MLHPLLEVESKSYCSKIKQVSFAEKIVSLASAEEAYMQCITINYYKTLPSRDDGAKIKVTS